MLTFEVKLRWQDYTSVILSTDEKNRVQQYRLRKIKLCYLPCKFVGFALVKAGMNGEVSVTVQPHGDATGQAAHIKSRQSCPWKGSQPSTIEPPVWGWWRRGQPSGQVGAVGSQVWASGPPWLRAGRWQLLSRWPCGFVHHPSLHTPHSCVKLILFHKTSFVQLIL